MGVETGLVTRPMKGTAGRGRWPAEDIARRRVLETSEKERAENLIIVDLIRNDLGRIADFGTVAVEDLMAIERYDTVWQMTTTVVGSVDPALRSSKCLPACSRAGRLPAPRRCV